MKDTILTRPSKGKYDTSKQKVENSSHYQPMAIRSNNYKGQHELITKPYQLQREITSPDIKQCGCSNKYHEFDTLCMPIICVIGTVEIRKWNIKQMGIHIKGRYISRTIPKPHKECGTNIGRDNRVSVSTMLCDFRS